MSNSKLATKVVLSPNHSGKRTMAIDRITPHCVVGQATAVNICNIFKPKTRKASCNYAIGFNGDIALCVDEGNRSWCSSSSANDQRAVTIECASDNVHPYTMTSAVWQSLISLCADICIRNGKNKLIWIPNKEKALSYKPKANEMLITVHRWFANKSCPGNWLYYRLPTLAEIVTASLNESGDEDVVTYTVVKGDTLWGIASKFLGSGARYKEIMWFNGMQNPVIYAGNVLRIPKK